VGFAPVGFVRIPARNTPRDIRAAREAMFAMTRPGTWNNTWWLDPVFLGRYPEDGLRLHAGHMPRFPRSDLQTICQPLDFFGANIYVGEGVAAGRDGRAVPCPTPDGHPLTGYDWWVTPACLYWGPRFYYERHKLPVMITENGLSVRDWISLDGAVHDPLRIDFLNRYLLELHRAIRDGARVTGYFQWSLLDNFEWHQGFKERFGLVHVDYATQKRTVKDSGHWYRQVIRSNGRSLSRRPRRTARA
jgi:beta-glucosidase